LGENLFKAIGSKYGEFLDFDSKTASRAKLDIACIKIATTFRGTIDDPLKIKAMGVVYSLRVVEEKTVDHGFYHGERFQDEECSWVASVNCPREALEVVDGVHGGSGNCCVDEDVEDDGVDPSLGQNQVHGGVVLHDGDLSLSTIRKVQKTPLVSGGFSEDQRGKLVTDGRVGRGGVENELQSSGSQGKEVQTGDSFGEIDREVTIEKVTCLLGGVVGTGGGPNEACGAFNASLSRSKSVSDLNRSKSLPPVGFNGPEPGVGLDPLYGLEFNDSISLCEFRGGANNNLLCETQKCTQETQSTAVLRRGRSRKPKDRPKLPRPSKQSILGVPKFVQLAEVVKEGSVRQRSRRRGGVAVLEQADSSDAGGSSSTGAAREVESCSVVQDSFEGLNLEVVLPAIEVTPNSGIALLMDDGGADVVRPLYAELESKKLLNIQHAVGFCYEEPNEAVIEILDIVEKRDREKMQEWEQRSGF
jgi:hypothetical protein